MSSPAPEVTPGLAAVRSWCGWHIAPSRPETVKVESEGGRVILLPSLFVTDCTEVRKEDDAAVTGWKVRQNGVARGHWAAEVEYAFDIVHGYEDMPQELLSIIAELDSGVGPAVASHSAGPFSETYRSSNLEDQPISVRAVVSRYRLLARP